MTLPFPSSAHPETDRRDDSLAAWIATGDEAAFTALYLRHHAALWKFAYGFVRSADVAEELVQDVFLSLWRRRSELQVDTPAGAWLYGAVRNASRNHLRHHRTSTRLLADAGALAARDATMGSAVPLPDALLAGNDLERDLTTALSELSERSRTAMTLRWKHDMSAAEIAGVLGATPGAVRVLLTRARQELASLLGHVAR